MKDHIVMTGTPTTGFQFIGPFTHDEAYAEFNRFNANAPTVAAVWVVRLVPPNAHANTR